MNHISHNLFFLSIAWCLLSFTQNPQQNRKTLNDKHFEVGDLIETPRMLFKYNDLEVVHIYLDSLKK